MTKIGVYGSKLLIMGHGDFDLPYKPEHMFCWVSCNKYVPHIYHSDLHMYWISSKFFI